jgi:DNA uptake protein ComE-like DNA-binding protein
MKDKNKKSVQNRSFVMGVVAFVFLVIGYQTALFVHSAAVAQIAANRDEPDTVYVYNAPDGGQHGKIDAGKVQVRRSGAHGPQSESIRRKLPRKVESFRFNPNTISKDDLQRLGFSDKQAQSIINYREKGGRFRRKEDFAKSYVVSDSIYRRLEAYIVIPKTDLNKADSAAFDALPGIGGWYASKMIAYRKELGGYSYTEQLMDIKNFDQDKYDALKDLVFVSDDSVTPFALWTLPADSLRKHPYIKNYETARSIVFFRENNPTQDWTVDKLGAAGILTTEQTRKLARCVIANP